MPMCKYGIHSVEFTLNNAFVVKFTILYHETSKGLFINHGREKWVNKN